MHPLPETPDRALRAVRPHMPSLVAACLLTLSGLSFSQTPSDTGLDRSGDYQKEMQACREGRTGQDRATCMQEARNAHQAKRQGALQTPSAQSMDANAMARCEGMVAADMAACRARMMGYGQTRGSVTGGGILRELEVIEMEPGQESVNVAPKGNGPVLVVPAPKQP
jgi:hypothetical protein